jgi:hypothetical protein
VPHVVCLCVSTSQLPQSASRVGLWVGLRKKSTRNLGELRVQDLGRGSHPDDQASLRGCSSPQEVGGRYVAERAKVSIVEVPNGCSSSVP